MVPRLAAQTPLPMDYSLLLISRPLFEQLSVLPGSLLQSDSRDLDYGQEGVSDHVTS